MNREDIQAIIDNIDRTQRVGAQALSAVDGDRDNLAARIRNLATTCWLHSHSPTTGAHMELYRIWHGMQEEVDELRDYRDQIIGLLIDMDEDKENLKSQL